jgi:hypothetical protein
MSLRETECRRRVWIQLDQDKIQWSAPENEGTNLAFLQNNSISRLVQYQLDKEVR